MPTEMAQAIKELEAFFVPTGFPQERIDYFSTALVTELRSTWGSSVESGMQTP